MPLFQKTSLRTKQLLICLLTSTVALILAGSAFATYEVLAFRTEMVRNLNTLADIIGDDAAAALDFDDPKDAESTLGTLRAEPNISAACIFDKTGKVFVLYDRSTDNRIAKAPTFQKPGFHFSADSLELFSPIDFKGETIGTVYIASDLEALYARLNRYALITAGVLIASLMAAFLVAGRLQRLVSDPILSLVQSARTVARDRDYSVRVERRSNDEIGILIDSFNQMLHQIQQRDIQLQRTQADLENRVAERTQEIAHSISLLHATLESTADGILVVNTDGKFVHHNQRFLDLWKLPNHALDLGEDLRLLPIKADQLKNADEFLDKAVDLYAHPDQESSDVLEFKDGRIIERISRPQCLGGKSVGRVWSFRDVTVQRTAERELRWKSAWLEAQLDSSNDGIIVMDNEGRKIYQNQRAVEIWRIPPEIASDPDHQKQIAYAASVTKNPNQTLEAIHQIHSDPAATVHDEVELTFGLTLDRFSYPVVGKDGARYGRIWSFRDVTARKKAEADLRWKSALLEALINSSQDGMVVLDAEGKNRVYQNSRLREIWDMPEDVFNDKDNWKQMEFVINAVRHPEKVRREMAQVVTHPDNVIHTEHELKNGIFIEPYSYPIKSEDGIRLGRLWQFRDVTARKHAELELNRERDLLDTLLTNSPDYIYFKDLDSKFLRVSRSLAESVDLPASSLIGKTDFDLFGDDHARDAYNDEKEIIRSGKPVLAKVERESRKEGRDTWAITSKMPLRNKAGDIIGTFGISKDVTAMKEAEAKLDDANRRLLETSRLAGMAEVATSVLHNVGNVLNSVNVSCTVVADRVRKSRSVNLGRAVALMREHEGQLATFLNDDPKGRQLPSYLTGLASNLDLERQEILEELSLLSTNVDHIKEIVAMQQSYAKVSGVRETLPPADLVEDALRMNGAAFERHGIKISRQFDSVPNVIVERHKVLQILINLLRNAKYACDDGRPPEKEIAVKIEPAADNNTRITVTDNGVGIAAENLSRIFEHGFTTRKEGHGFGLHSGAIAAKEMGGRLTAFSEGVGRGATFSLTLPCSSTGAS